MSATSAAIDPAMMPWRRRSGGTSASAGFHDAPQQGCDSCTCHAEPTSERRRPRYAPLARHAQPSSSSSRHRLDAWLALPIPAVSHAAALASGSTTDISLHAQPAPIRPSLATSQHERYFIRSITEDERPGHAPPPVCETDHASLASLDAKRRLGESGSASAPGGENISSTGRTVLIKDKTSWSYVLRSGLAGGIAGCVAKTAIAPLDRVKILFQAQNPEFAKYSGRAMGVFRAARDIVRSQGPTALFQGHSATLLRIFPYAAIKYMAYDKLHFHLMPTKRDETGARLFLAGSASGVLSVFMTYPLELIRVRLAFETKGKKGTGGLRRIVQQIYTEGATEAPFSSDARRRAARSGGGSGGAGAAAAKSVASTSTAHLSTSAIQAQAIAAGAGPHSPVPLSESPGAASRLLAQWPVLKFYRGFSVTVMGMIPYAGTSFLVFGRCKTALQTLFPPGEDEVAQGGRKKWWWPSKTTVDLTAGALAGAISQTAAYPFEVIRRRQQVGATVRPGSLLGMRETALWIWRTSGFRGFYVGLSIGFLKVVPMTSISFAVWLGMKRSMGI